MGFYVRHLKSKQAKEFAPIIEKAFLSPAEDNLTTVTLYSSKAGACKDALSAAYAVLRDNPIIFYYKINLSCSSIGSQVVLKAEQIYTINEINQLRRMIDSEIQRIITPIKAKQSAWEKELAIFDCLHDSVQYLDDATNEEGNIVGPLLLKRGVCEGISKLFAVLCHEAGIPCILVFGRDHMWNMVSIDGISSHVDVTYGIGQTPCNYSYFNVPDKELMRDHQKELDCIPTSVSNKTDYYHMMGGFFTSESELKRYLRTALWSGRRKTIHVKLENGDPEKVLKEVDLFFPKKVSYVLNKTMKTLTIQQGGNI